MTSLLYRTASAGVRTTITMATRLGIRDRRFSAAPPPLAAATTATVTTVTVGSTSSAVRGAAADQNPCRGPGRRRRRRLGGTTAALPLLPLSLRRSFPPRSVSTSKFSSSSLSTFSTAPNDDDRKATGGAHDDHDDPRPFDPPPSDEELHSRGLPLLVRASGHADRIMCDDPPADKGGGTQNGRSRAVTYRDVLLRSARASRFFLERYLQRLRQPHEEEAGTGGERIAFLCSPSSNYVAVQWGCWSSGSVAVPLCASHRSPEFEHVLADSDPMLVVCDDHLESYGELRRAAERVGMEDRLVSLRDEVLPPSEDRADGEDEAEAEASPLAIGQGGAIVSMDSPAMIVYTSGTTGRPKGVLTTHRAIHHQITDLVSAWEWTSDDVILHFLPLHHVHGIINKLCCAAYAGARVEFMKKFDAEAVWKRLGEGGKGIGRKEITLFMAVPTIYAKLIESSRTLPPTVLDPALRSCRTSVRLMVSGSAALPTTVMEEWERLTGHVLLERYGMTEFAMALSNPYRPVSRRLPGYVGQPLPSVQLRIVEGVGEGGEEEGEKSVVDGETAAGCSRERIVSPPLRDGDPGDGDGCGIGRSGELRVRGPTVFKEYWRRPDATSEAFDDDGYFRTGDVAKYSAELDSFRILGRASVDIIKCGGYKISALEIERVLLEHDDVEELAVLGVEDEIWGERVAVICRMKEGRDKLSLEELREWCSDKMASYKVPSRLVVLKKDIPKNAMGKVSKKQLAHYFT